MKVTFEKEKLLAAIGPAASISQVKNTLTAVEGILFECPANEKFGKVEDEEKGMTRISAYDLEKGLRTTVECKIYEPGSCVINSSRILQIAREMPDGEITIEIDDNLKAVISGGQAHYTISVSSSDDFPAMPLFVGDKYYTVPQYALRTLIGRVIFAVAQNDPRPGLNGALLKVKDGVMTMVGCDGSRLSLASYDTEDKKEDAEVIIPGKFLGELSRLLKDTEDETTVIIGRKHIILKIDNLYFFTRLIESTYMDYSRVLPKKYSAEAYLDPKELKEALDRASIISEDKLGGNNRAIVKLDFEGQMITVSCVSSEGSMTEKVNAAIGGDPITIGFAGRFLSDALKACPDETARIRIRLNSPVEGVVIEDGEGSKLISYEGEEVKESKDNKDRFDFLHLVMPRRLNQKV